MTETLAFAAWRRGSGGAVEILRVFGPANSGPGQSRLRVTSTIGGGAPAPVTTPVNGIGWQRIAFYHRQDPNLPQLVLDLVGWGEEDDDNNGIAVDPTPGHESIAFRGNLRFLLWNRDLSPDIGRRTGILSARGTWAAPAGADWPFGADGSVALTRIEWKWGGDSNAGASMGSSLAELIKTAPKPFLERREGVRKPLVMELLNIATTYGPRAKRCRYAYFFEYKPDSDTEPEGQSIPRFGLAFTQGVFILPDWPGVVPGIAWGIAPKIERATQHWLVQRQSSALWRSPFPRDGRQHWVVEIDGIAGNRVRQWWNMAALPSYLAGQRQILGPRAFSFAPSFAGDADWGEYTDHDPADHDYAVYLKELGWWLSFDVFDGASAEQKPDGDALLGKLSWRLRGLVPQEKHADARSAQITLAAFRDHDGHGLTAAAATVQFEQCPGEDTTEYPEPSQQDLPTPSSIRARDARAFVVTAMLRDRAQANLSVVNYAVGAFDLTVAPLGADAGTGEKNILALTIRFATDREKRSTDGSEFERIDHVAVPRPVVQVAVEAQLPLAAIRPGGQDAAPGVARNRPHEAVAPGLPSEPIVIDLTASGQQASLFLRAQEASPTLNASAPANRLVQAARELKLTVYRQQAANGRTADFDVFVLDLDPFVLTRVSLSLSGDTATGDDTAVFGEALLAEGLDLAWQRLSPGNVTLMLPPQGLGEEMEKRKTVANGDPTNFRLAPPALLELDMAARAELHAGEEIPWNTRRLLGWPGEQVSGTPIRRLKAEMLYGMRLELDIAPRTDSSGQILRATGLGPQAAEIGARAGRMVGAPAVRFGSDPLSKMGGFWQQIVTAARKRLAVIEIYDPLAPEQFARSDGVSYVLRHGPDDGPNTADDRTADLHYPIDGIVTESQRPGDRPSDRNAPALRPDGLRGGVSWPFESANIYEAVWRRTDGYKARGPGDVARLFLSALGGWSKQTGYFDNRRTKIQTDIGMGRTHYFSLERLGRIGVLWNRAKHVIVYERTVLPTRQFVKEQNWLVGRPILRKVHEYVEILEPERDYPDSSAPTALTGFLKASRFRTIKIAVDSVWGGDVRNIGWQVPLWRPDADPVVYPKPHILLSLAADPQTRVDAVDAEIDNPQNLVFYTLTTSTTDDRIDLWGAQATLDFTDRPVPTPPPLPAQYADDPDAPMPDAAAIEEGYEQFTFSLLPTSHAVDVGAKRGGTGVGTQIHNVTLMRATRRAAPAMTQAKTAYDRANEVAALSAQLDKIFQAAQGGIAAINAGHASVDAVKQSISNDFSQSLTDGAADTGTDKLAGNLKNFFSQTPDLFDPCTALKKAQRQLIEAAAQRLHDTIEAARADMKASVPGIIGAAIDPLHKSLEGAVQRLRDLLSPPGFSLAGLDIAVGQAQSRIANLAVGLGDRVQELRRALDPLFVDPAAAQLVAALASSTLGAVLAPLSEAERAIPAGLVGPLGEAANTVVEAVGAARSLVESTQAAVLELAAQLGTGAGDFATEIDDALAGLLDALGHWAQDLDAELQQLADTLGDAADALVGTCQTKLDALIAPLEKLAETIIGERAAVLNAIDAAFDALVKPATIDGLVKEIADAGDQQIEDLCSMLGGALSDVLGEFDDLIASLIKDVPDAFKDLSTAAAALQQLEANARRAVGRLTNQLGDEVRKAMDSLLPAGDTVHQAADQAMRLVRAFGAPPRLPGLDFGRDLIGYYFGDALDRVDITPVTTLLDRAGDSLKALGLRLPTLAIGDQLLADQLKGLDFSRILPDFAGIRLDHLLPGFALPEIPQDRMRVRHGVDSQSRRGWVEATVNVPSDETATLFSFGPLVLQIVSPHFTADTRLDVDAAGGGAQSHTLASIDGDWELLVGGFRIVSFVETPLTFSSADGVRFAIRPENVRMDEALTFLSDLLEEFSASADDMAAGLGLSIIRENGLPIGASSSLSLPVPDLQLGAFGLSNMTFGAGFEIRALPDFAIGVRANFGRSTAPFNLTIFILGGGGWVEANARYLPLTNALSTDVTIGITASAGLALALGPIRGSIMMYVGIYAELHSESSGHSSLTVGLMFMIIGQASLAGLVTVAVQLRLDAIYRDDGSLTGTGTLSYSIKICWCFTLRITQSVSYVLVKGSGGRTASPDQRKQRLRDHYS